MPVMANSEDSMVGANSVVAHQHHAQVFVGHPGLMKCRIFGEHIVFAVTYTHFVDINGQRPGILDTSLCRVRFVTDFTVDPLIDKFNFGPTAY